MEICFSTMVNGDFDCVVEKTAEELKKEGFGVLTDIDVKETLKKKLDVDFRRYRILGACNPTFAYQALLARDKVGVLLPCNVIVQESEPGQVEVSFMDPALVMQVMDDPRLAGLASEVREKLLRVRDGLNR